MTDTEAARNDLRIAHKFLLDFEQHDLESSLHQAMDYLRQARANDPDVTWQHKNEKKEVVTMTPDILEAIVLHHLATPVILDRDASLEKRHAAIGILERSLSLRPIPMTYKRLFSGYIDTNQREKALAIITEANHRYPEDHVIRSNFDWIKQDQTIGTPPRKPVNVFAISLLLAMAFLAFSILAANYQSSNPSPPPHSPGDFFIAFGYISRIALLVCGIVAFFTRPRMPQEYYDQLNR